MQNEHLPDKVNAVKFAEHATHLHGSIPVKNLQRLLQSVAGPQGAVHADIEFGVDEIGCSFIKGEITTQLTLQCQRCMQPFLYAIMGSFLLGMVTQEKEIAALPKHYEPVFVTDAMVSLYEIVEDEVIIDLPIVPMHREEDCHIKLPLETREAEANDNPFKVIEVLKSKSADHR